MLCYPSVTEATLHDMGKRTHEATGNTQYNRNKTKHNSHVHLSGLILGWHIANERRRYKVTPPLIGWAQT